MIVDITHARRRPQSRPNRQPPVRRRRPPRDHRLHANFEQGPKV